MACVAFFILVLNVKDMANLIHCSLTLDEYAVLGLLREARGRGYHRIEKEVYAVLVELFERDEPEVIILDQDPLTVDLYEIIDLTGGDEDGVPDIAGLIGKYALVVNLFVLFY